MTGRELTKYYNFIYDNNTSSYIKHYNTLTYELNNFAYKINALIVIKDSNGEFLGHLNFYNKKQFLEFIKIEFKKEYRIHKLKQLINEN